MKKIPVQVTDKNTDFMNEHGLSFAKVINHAIDQLRELNSLGKSEQFSELKSKNAPK